MSFHSRAYRKHFEGYTERRNPLSGAIERVYTAKYYKSGLSDRALKGRKCLYAGLFLFTAALWLAVSVSGLPGTMVKYVSIFTALALFPLFLTAVSVASFCAAARKMTICQYQDSSVRLKWSALAAGIVLVLTGLAELIFVILNREAFLWQEFLGVAGFFAAAAMMFTLFWLEHTTDYLLIPNENSVLSDDEDAAEIDV